ncbi:MAG: DUF4214 domain-containing protein [Marinobacterium sp.]|nr:DUF4214 domain-containing protein [Marinobacterium sp.]
MAYVKRGTSTAGIDFFAGSAGADTENITGTGAYFGLQGDDVMSTNWQASGAVMVGGSGNDTYVINGDTTIMDAGGGSDTLAFEYLNRQDIPLINWTLVNIDNQHLIVADDYDGVVLFNYQSEHSRIENVRFANGETISFQQMLNMLIEEAGSPLPYSMTQFAIPPTTADDINNMLSELYTFNQQYEAEITASGIQRQASLSDAQMIGRLYQAAFNRVPDEGGLNNWIDMWEKGWTTEKIASAFIASEEFSLRYGADTSDADYVQALYVNALGREPDQAGYNAWLYNLQNGGVSRETMLLGFSDSAENVSRTEQTFAQLTEANDQWLFL